MRLGISSSERERRVRNKAPEIPKSRSTDEQRQETIDTQENAVLKVPRYVSEALGKIPVRDLQLTRNIVLAEEMVEDVRQIQLDSVNEQRN